MYTSRNGDIEYIHKEVVSENAKFQGMTVYSGEPRNLEALVPDNEGMHDSVGNHRWIFGSKSDQLKKPVHIACFYEGERLGLFMKLSMPVASCENNQMMSRILICQPM
jgi:hypothetical protein